MGFEDVEWIDVAENMVKWLAFVNAVMGMRVAYHAKNLLNGWTIMKL